MEPLFSYCHVRYSYTVNNPTARFLSHPLAPYTFVLTSAKCAVAIFRQHVFFVCEIETCFAYRIPKLIAGDFLMVGGIPVDKAGLSYLCVKSGRKMMNILSRSSSNTFHALEVFPCFTHCMSRIILLLSMV